MCLDWGSYLQPWCIGTALQPVSRPARARADFPPMPQQPWPSAPGDRSLCHLREEERPAVSEKRVDTGYRCLVWSRHASPEVTLSWGRQFRSLWTRVALSTSSPVSPVSRPLPSWLMAAGTTRALGLEVAPGPAVEEGHRSHHEDSRCSRGFPKIRRGACPGRETQAGGVLLVRLTVTGLGARAGLVGWGGKMQVRAGVLVELGHQGVAALRRWA